MSELGDAKQLASNIIRQALKEADEKPSDKQREVRRWLLESEWCAFLLDGAGLDADVVRAHLRKRWKLPLEKKAVKG